MSAKQRRVHHSKTCCQVLKHFDNVFATGGNKTVVLSVWKFDSHAWRVALDTTLCDTVCPFFSDL